MVLCGSTTWWRQVSGRVSDWVRLNKLFYPVKWPPHVVLGSWPAGSYNGCENPYIIRNYAGRPTPTGAVYMKHHDNAYQFTLWVLL